MRVYKSTIKRKFLCFLQLKSYFRKDVFREWMINCFLPLYNYPYLVLHSNYFSCFQDFLLLVFNKRKLTTHYGLGEDGTGGRKRERAHFVFHSIFLLKFYYPLLSLLSFIRSLQVIALFVCVSLLLDPQADYGKIYLHCLLFLIFSNEVSI